MFAITLMPMALTSCGDDTPTPTPTPTPTTENLSGSITGNTTLKADVEYFLTGPLLVEEGGVLNIPAGTTIKARKGFGSYILVLKGGKINATGTAEKPIRMTADIANAGNGYWGGLIINGKAPLEGGKSGSTEINSAYLYGGNDAADNSGVLTYVILEYTGAKSSANVEHNGLTLNGVGNGTKIENIYIPSTADDGIEFFGGTVNVKNLLVVNSDDDMFDFTQGYTGTLENCYGIWEANYTSGESDPRGIEADGNWDGLDPNVSGQSDFKVNNMTIDLKLAFNADAKTQMQDVMKIRRGAKATITNALVKGTGSVGNIVDFSDSKGAGNATSVVNVTNKLTTPPAAADLVKGNGIVNWNTGNTGCDKNLFTWTAYKNF